MLFDCHTHIMPPVPLRDVPRFCGDDLVRVMDGYGIDKAIVLPGESPEVYYCTLPTWLVLQECDRHPDRLVPFCDFDPRLAAEPSEERFRTILEDYIAAGCKGFGEHKPGLDVDDERSKIVYGLCGELGLCCLLHIDNTHNVDELGLPRFEAVLGEFPGTNFIAHGPGWWREMSSEVNWEEHYPEGPVKPGGRAPELMARYPNLYGDLSAGSGFNALDRDGEFAKGFVIEHCERLLFGTDLLRPDQEAPIIDLLQDLDLPSEMFEAVTHENLERLLGIAPG